MSPQIYGGTFDPEAKSVMISIEPSNQLRAFLSVLQGLLGESSNGWPRVIHVRMPDGLNIGQVRGKLMSYLFGSFATRYISLETYRKLMENLWDSVWQTYVASGNEVVAKSRKIGKRLSIIKWLPCLCIVIIVEYQVFHIYLWVHPIRWEVLGLCFLLILAPTISRWAVDHHAMDHVQPFNHRPSLLTMVVSPCLPSIF